MFVIAVPEEGVGWSGSATTGNSVTRSSKGSVEHEDVAPHRRVSLDALASKSEQLLQSTMEPLGLVSPPLVST